MCMVGTALQNANFISSMLGPNWRLTADQKCWPQIKTNNNNMVIAYCERDHKVYVMFINHQTGSKIEHELSSPQDADVLSYINN